MPDTTLPTVNAPAPGPQAVAGRPQAAADRPQAKPLPRWNVVLVDDDDHTYDYVIEMLINLFGHSLAQGFRLARTVDRDGRAVVFTAHREHAELKREQIRGFGTDPRLTRSRGAMAATIEPAD